MENGISKFDTRQTQVAAWNLSLSELAGEAALKRLTNWINQKQLSVKEMACNIGVNDDTLEKFLTGRDRFTLNYLLILQGLYGLNVRHVLYAEEPPTLKNFTPLLLD